MTRRVLCAFAFVALFASIAAAQQPSGYLDVMIVKVKPDKRADFDAIVKKIVDVNRRHQGDRWVASEVMYGEGNTVSFTSGRETLGDIDKGSDQFLNAMSEAYGQTGVGKVMQDFNNCIVSSRSEIRRRRPDLSIHMPSDLGALERMVADSRWVRTNAVHARPGHVADVEAQLKIIKEAMEKADPQNVTLVSQSIAGTEGTIFYISTYRIKVGGFDGGPSLHELLGQEGYEKYRSAVAESVQSIETMLTHFLPELSNPPESFLAASPDFWTPKPTALAKAASKASIKPVKK